MRTVGVEEEFLLVTFDHRRTSPVATQILQIAAARGDAGDRVDEGSLVHELQEQQVETYTSPQDSMSTLEAELRVWRDKAGSAAAEAGARLVASATSPVAVEPRLVQHPRYVKMAEQFGMTAREQLTCGCHIHVSITSLDEAVGVLNRIRVWLPALLALSANSPFWQGQDTGYASYRWLAMARWPASGPTDIFDTPETYHTLVDRLIASGIIMDEGMLYFDARCSRRYPTVEIRVPDVCLDVRDAVLIAALCRALVATSAEEWAAGEEPPPVRTALLRLATWQAARWGIGGSLLDPLTYCPHPAADVIAALLDHVRPALRCSGDEALVTEGVDRIFDHGTGATRQRDVFARTGDLSEVIATIAATTSNHAG